VQVGVSDDLSLLVDRKPDFTTFCLTAGVHRVARPILVKGHDRIIGAPGAILDGSRLLTDFVKSGAYWLASGQTQEGTYLVGECAVGYPMCQRPDDVFYDDQPLRHVATLAEVGPGRFYFDYSADRIYLGDNPMGHKVEEAVVGQGLYGHASGHALISGLLVQKFAGTGIRGTDWDIESSEVRLNHRAGISVDHDAIIRNNYIHDNGQLGIGMSGDTRANILVTDNEIARNNYAGFCPCWESGGIKYGKSINLTIQNNYVHNNNGPGIWIDYDNNNIVIDNNRVEDNTNEGIIVEASFNTVVRNNIVRRNGLKMSPTWMQGAGIVNQSSANVDVYGNTVEGNLNGIGATQRARGSGTYGVREVRNFTVHDNVVSMSTGQSGLIETTGNSTYYTSKGNLFTRNTYRIGCQAKPFVWRDPAGQAPYAGVTVTQWAKTGNDAGSAVSATCP
jgi:parallel beta-helix repeat protein